MAINDLALGGITVLRVADGVASEGRRTAGPAFWGVVGGQDGG